MSTSDKNTASRTKPVLPRCIMTQTSLSHCWVIKESTQPKLSETLRQVFENMLLCPEHSFLRRKHPQVHTKRKSYQKLFSKHAIKEVSAKVYISETGNESSSNKDLHSFVEEERCFSNPNRMNKKHSKCAFIRQTGGYINA